MVVVALIIHISTIKKFEDLYDLGIGDILGIP